jgi:hypothetical protein
MDPIVEKIRQAVRPRRAVTWSVTELVAWLDEVEPIADRRGKFDWLEIPPIASPTAIQDAYHQIARTRHPDLFRNRVDAVVMDRLVRMYGRVTGAYADLKEPEKCAAYLRELRGPRVPTVPPVSHGGAGTAQLSSRLGVSAMQPMRSEISSSHRPGAIEPPPLGRSESTASTPRPQSTTAAPPVTAPPARSNPPTAPPPVATSPPSERTSQPMPRQSGDIEPAHAMNARALAFYRRAEGALKVGDASAAMLNIKMAIAADPRSTFLRAALAELSKK